MLSKNAYPRRKTTKKVPVEKSVENVENLALSTDIPMRPPAARNPENESTGCIFTGTRAAVPGYVAVAFCRESEKNRNEMLDFCLVRLPRTGTASSRAKKICVKFPKKRGLKEIKGAKNIF